jgi:hypothetical protein
MPYPQMEKEIRHKILIQMRLAIYKFWQRLRKVRIQHGSLQYVTVTLQLNIIFRFYHLTPEMGKHPDLLVAHPTSTIFTTIGRNFVIS